MSTAIYETKVETIAPSKQTCDCCEVKIAVVQITYNTGHIVYYCNTCISERYFKCCTCKKYFNKDEVTETAYYQTFELKDNEVECLMCDYEGEQNYEKTYTDFETYEDEYQEWRNDYNKGISLAPSLSEESRIQYKNSCNNYSINRFYK